MVRLVRDHINYKKTDHDTLYQNTHAMRITNGECNALWMIEREMGAHDLRTR
jgi:hypothetical protein